MVPIKIRQHADTYAEAHKSDHKDTKLLLVEAYIAGATQESEAPLCASAPGAEESEAQCPGSDALHPSIPFEAFWQLYDKKRGRPKALALWQKLSLRDRQAIMDYIPLYKQAQPDKQYRKDPQTFLRNRSWEDELIFNKPHQNAQQQRLSAYASAIASVAEESQ